MESTLRPDTCQPARKKARAARSPMAVRLAFSFLMAAAANAYAANQNSECIPQPYPVPGLPGPPNWLTPNSWDGVTNIGTAAQPQYNDWINDPRWTGALGIGHTYGTLYDVKFRAVAATTNNLPTLYLSWNVRLDPAQNNTLYVGFFPENAKGGTPAGTGYVFQVGLQLNQSGGTCPASGCPNDASSYNAPFAPPVAQTVAGTTFFTASLYQEAAQNEWSGVSAPWLNSVVGNMRISKLPNATWNVEMEIPVDSTGANGPNLIMNPDSTFLFWYDVEEVTPGGTPSSYHWPRPDAYQFGASVLNGPPPPVATGVADPFTQATQWGEVGLTLLNPSCSASNVVSLNDITQVGTNNTPTAADPNPQDDEIRANGINQFFAKPINNWSPGIPAGQLNVTFRIADWGSTYDPTAPWTVLPNLQNVPTTTAIAGDAPIDLEPPMAQTILDLSDATVYNQTSADGQCKLRCDLLGSAGTPAQSGPSPSTCQCPSAPAKTTDQCILVTLGGNVDIDPDSIRRNMSIVHASNFERNAQIDIGGLPPIGTPTRDVYVYVEKLNMPSFPAVIHGTPAPPKLIQPPPSVPPPVLDVRRRESSYPVSYPAPTTSLDPSVQMAKALPTELLHVFDASGRTRQINGVSTPILVPQGSFGYFVQHQGVFFGWQSAISSVTPGLVITQIAPDWFKLSGVPDGGKVVIETQISTIDFTTWWIWVFPLIILLIILLLIWLIRRLVHA
jgi:hypothetical protein